MKPKICMVGWHTCIRVTKMAQTLIKKGYEVHLITGMLPIMYNSYASVQVYNIGDWYRGSTAPSVHQLVNAVRSLRDKVDVFHVHNEPDWIVNVVAENKGKAKLIYDIHDLLSIRTKREEPDERRAIENADAIVTISEPYKNQIKSKYKIKKPFIVIKSCVPEDLYVLKPLSHADGIVYEGGVNPVISNMNFLQYRNFAGFLKYCNDNKINFHIFPADPGFDYSYYRNNGAYLYPPKMYPLLLEELSRFDFGFAGTPIPDPEFAGSLPNKIFEYAAAGIPSLVFNAPTSAEFVEKNGLGVAIKSDEDVKKAISEKDKLKELVLKNRWNFTMQKEIAGLENLYGEI